jgi:hypothetical protein
MMKPVKTAVRHEPAVVKLPFVDPAYRRLLDGTGDQQDALYFAIRSIDAAIGSLKASKTQLLSCSAPTELSSTGKASRPVRLRCGPPFLDCWGRGRFAFR